MKFPGSEDDLTIRLSNPPEMKPEVSSEGAPVSPVPEAMEPQPEPPKVKADDFSPKPEPPVQEAKPEVKQEEPKKPYSFYEKQAVGFIGLLDGLSSSYLPVVYKKRLISEEGIKRAEEISDLIKSGKTDDLSDEDKLLMQHFVNVEKAIKAIPFTSEEKEMLIGPLAETMEKYSTALGPEWRLAIAVGAVTFPRILPLWRGV